MNTPAPSANDELDVMVAVRTGSQPSTLNSQPSTWLIASDISRALGSGWHKKKIHRLAQREGWPSRTVANRLEYLPPPHIAAIVLASPSGPAPAKEAPSVRFADLTNSDPQRELVLLRKRAVQLLQANTAIPKETALQLVCNHMIANWRNEVPDLSHVAKFSVSVRSLRNWERAFNAHGIDGLVEQKRGRVGRKSFASTLDQNELFNLAAASTESGIKGRLNIARAYRDTIVASPTLNAQARAVLHGEHSKKSYVPDSIREAVKLTVPPLAARLIQIGPKSMKLNGPYTECCYESIRPGSAFTADDMTANVYVWVEWPNTEGFLLIRPQLLAVMDIGSLAWLNIRAVMRPKGQYTKDDVWGLIGDTLDNFGLFQTAILEGGTWQSDVVRGHRTGLSDEERFGGLESAGVKVIHTRTPRGKIIEQAFNVLQAAMDKVKGFCGRDERRDCPELVKQHLALVRGGKAHPRQFFLHINEFTDHVHAIMRALNNERNDGKILRGSCASEKWSERGPMLPMPETSKYFYRSTFSVVTISRNGVRVTLGSGKHQLSYSYDHEALKTRQGMRAIVFWNDYNPDTDACVYTIKNGKPYQLICVASRVASLNRIGASAEEMGREAARKKMAYNMAITQSRSLAPYLQRTATPHSEGGPATAGRLTPSDNGKDAFHPRPHSVPASDSSSSSPLDGRDAFHPRPQSNPLADIKTTVQAARDAQEEKESLSARVRASVRKVETTSEDLAALCSDDSQPSALNSQLSSNDLSSLFTQDQISPDAQVGTGTDDLSALRGVEHREDF